MIFQLLRMGFLEATVYCMFCKQKSFKQNAIVQNACTSVIKQLTKYRIAMKCE